MYRELIAHKVLSFDELMKLREDGVVMSGGLGDTLDLALLALQAMTKLFEDAANQADTAEDERDAALSKLGASEQHVAELQEVIARLGESLATRESRLDSALESLTEIYRLSDGITDEMTLPEIGTIALGAIQKPAVERQSLK